MTDVLFFFQFESISPRKFYGKKPNIFVLLPSDDPNVSNVGLSSSDEEDTENVPPNGQLANNQEWDSGDDRPLATLRLPVVADQLDDDWESEDELPLKNLVPKKKKTIYHYTWVKTDFVHDQTPVEITLEPPPNVSTPLKYFERFFDQDIFDYIAVQTNLYSTLATGSSINTNSYEIKSFVGIEIIMGIVQMPSLEDYWATQTRYPIVAKVMPVKRFKKLRRFIHFQDNNLDTQGDPLFKIRPLLEKVRQNCSKIKPENMFSIDEMMVAYKGSKAESIRQYVPKKPKKWGFKMFVRAGVSGIVYDFLLYTGAKTFDNIEFTDIENSFDLGGKVVLALCKAIETKQDTTVYFDNFFTSLDLLVFLKREFGLSSLGIIRSNGLKGCILENDKSLLRKGRGSLDYKVDNHAGVAVVKRADSKYIKEEKKKIDVECPQIIRQYNTHMGGDAWLLLVYRGDMDTSGYPKHDNLKTFRTSLAFALIKGQKPTKRMSKPAKF
nr:unnamed protein product [Callosobruchus analis]